MSLFSQRAGIKGGIKRGSKEAQKGLNWMNFEKSVQLWAIGHH